MSFCSPHNLLDYHLYYISYISYIGYVSYISFAKCICRYFMNYLKPLEITSAIPLSSHPNKQSTYAFIKFTRVFFIRIFFIRRNIYVTSNIFICLFFFENIFTFFYKLLIIIVFNCSKNRISQYYRQTNALGNFFFWILSL